MQSTVPFNEREIILRLSEGDEAAFALVYNYYQPKLSLYIAPFTYNSKEDTEEIIQDIFVKIWMRRETLLAIENFQHYLFRMARNQFLDSQKKKKSYTVALNGNAERENEFRSPVHERMVFDEYSAVARKAIDTLSPQRKTIFLMRYESDRSISEIAEDLKIAKQSVKNQLYEATKLVKEYLQAHGDLPVVLLLLLFPHFPAP